MKIGIVCPYNLSLPGGVQQHVFEQARELKKRGHTVKILTPKPRTELVFDDTDVLFIGQSRRIKTPQHTSMDVSISVSGEAIDALLEEQKFDVIHIHEPIVPILARQMLPRITVPVVGTFHAALPETVVAKSIAGSIAPYVKSIVKHLNAITAVSQAATSYVGDYVPAEEVNFIPNGVDLVQYVPAPKKTHRKDILYVGRLEKRKGVKYLVEAFALLHRSHPDVRLIIAGNGPDRDKLSDLAHELGVGAHIDFLGYVSEQEKIALLQNAMIFVSPALYGESFGIVLIEAMATGTPAIGGNNVGYASVLTRTGSVGLVDPLNADLFASRMALLLEDEDLRLIWQKWALKDVKQYSYKSIVDSYEKIYKRLVKRKS